MRKREKRTATVTVRMTPAELEAVKKAARQRWPGLERLMSVSLSNTVRSLALLAASVSPNNIE